MLSVNYCMIIIPHASIFPRPSSKLSYQYGLCPFPDIYERKFMLYMCISHEEEIVFPFTIKINFFMILMSPLNIIQQRYIY